MTTIDIHASSPYRAEIGAGALRLLGDRCRTLCPKAGKAVVVSDDNVFPLHGETALRALRNAGLEAVCFILPHGEASKNAENLLALLQFCTGQGLTRSDVLVALGGGMIGDLTGFAAAVYMRGIAYIQCPTTLLAAVDSSVGGKTAVDLPAGKNLMGAFWQPAAVLCDTDALATLPDSVFTDGCAEVIKTALLFDPELFQLLEQHGKSFDPEPVIARCVAHKRDVVAEDEFDTGRRALLNLGHTLGHAVEQCSHYSLSHGQAVAIGMAVVCRAAAKDDICPPALPERVCALLTQFGLPVHTDIPLLTELVPVMLSDKKRSGSTVTVIVPESIGQCALHPMSPAELAHFMGLGLNQ